MPVGKILRSKQSGFSLIEIMLVIAILAVITMYFVSGMQKRQQRTAVDTTVKSIQTLLQAGNDYYNTHKEWPTTWNNFFSVDQAKSNMDFCSPYVGDCKDSQGNKLASCPCPNKAVYYVTPYTSPYTAQTSSYMSISIKLPDRNIAQQVVNRLPSAILDSNNIVTAYTYGIPRPPKPPERGWLVSAGVKDNEDNLSLPNCPPGYEGHFIPGLQHYTTDKGYDIDVDLELVCLLFTGCIPVPIPKGSDVYFNILLSPKELSKNNDDKWEATVAHGNYVIEASSKNKKLFMYYLTFCLPNGAWLDTSDDTSASYAQCPSKNESNDSNWEEYNTGNDVLVCNPDKEDINYNLLRLRLDA